MIKKRITLIVGGFLTWMLLTFSFDLEHIVLGIIIGVLVSYLTADIFDARIKLFRNIKSYYWFVIYVFVFTWECIKANIDGAYRVVHPDVPIRPGIVKVKTRLKSDTGITFLANSLTLKPGTMTVDVDRENGFLYVHWVDVHSADIDKATALIVKRFENILIKIFG